MNCQEVVERMHRYLDRDLTSDETAQMYQHIAVCPMCAETFNILKSLNRELEDLPAVTPPVSLVDAIMPKLDAIDRDRQNLVTPPAAKSQEPAEMMPEIRRPRRAAGWWSSVGGRTAIGAVAAALILGVAIFNYEPKMLSDAEIPFKEEASTTSAGMPDEAANTQEMARTFTEGSPAANDMNDDGSAESVDPQSSAIEPVPSSNPGSDEPKDQGDPAEYVEKPGEDTNGQDKPDQSTPNRNEVDPSTTSTPDPSATNKAGVQDKNATNPTVPSNEDPPAADTGANSQTAPAESMDPSAEMPPPVSDPSADEGGAESNSMESSDRVTGSMYGMMKAPEQWSSPDGQYMASVELDNLVIYRMPTGNGGSTEAVEAVGKIPLSGTWVSGQWSEDGLTFKYKVQINKELIESVYSVEKLQPSQSAQQKQPKP